jgi:Domain of unknown function (DUF4167)
MAWQDNRGANVKRSRGRGRRGPPNHHNRAFDSAGPDIKIRGTAANIYEKYLQLARDAGSAGDRVAQENFLQHAEHYYRIMMANQTQFQQQGGQPQGGQQGYQQQGNPQAQQQGNYLQQNPHNSGQAGGQAGGDGHNPNVPQQQPYTQPVAGSTPSFTLSDQDGDEAEENEPDEARAK